MNQKHKSISKFLSLVLRHRPEAIGVELDENGWLCIDELLRASKIAGKKLDHELLLEVVNNNDKQRFAISEDGSKIRANQGHSVEIDLALHPVSPPAILYHGTVKKFLTNIRLQGLLPRNRNHVHLSGDIETATTVGKRRGEPVVLTIDSQKMNDAGIEFFQSNNGVWLTVHVPTQYISYPLDED